MNDFAAIETVIARPGARVVAELAAVAAGSVKRVARRLVALPPASRVLILTGAYIPWALPPGPETDGPVGTAALACVLEEIGLEVLVATDDVCQSAVAACLSASRSRSEVLTFPRDVDPSTLRTDQRLANIAYVVVVERLVRNIEGRPCNMRGDDMSAVTAPLDILLDVAKVGTVTIGDGGNEVGMARLGVDAIAQHVAFGDRIAAASTADDCIIAGAANWGCYGLMAAIAMIKPVVLPGVPDVTPVE